MYKLHCFLNDAIGRVVGLRFADDASKLVNIIGYGALVHYEYADVAILEDGELDKSLGYLIHYIKFDSRFRNRNYTRLIKCDNGMLICENELNKLIHVKEMKFENLLDKVNFIYAGIANANLANVDSLKCLKMPSKEEAEAFMSLSMRRLNDETILSKLKFRAPLIPEAYKFDQSSTAGLGTISISAVGASNRHVLNWNDDHEYCENHYDAYNVVDDEDENVVKLESVMQELKDKFRGKYGRDMRLSFDGAKDTTYFDFVIPFVE